MAFGDIDVPRAVLVALAVVVAGALVVGGATSGVAFDAFNPDWDGTSDLRATADAAGSEPVFVQNTSQYNNYGSGDVAFVLAPDREYDARSAGQVRGFVERGGILVVAERDGSPGHALLEGVGTDARPEGPILRDERHHYRNPALPIADEVAAHSFVASVESVTLNHGTAVEPDGATILAASSPYAYLDLDGNGEISPNETADSYPVATVEGIGDGQVVVVGDPSVFINVMQDETDNQAFAAALVDGTDNTLVDVSHASSPPPLMAVLLTIRNSALLQAGLGVGALAVLGVGGRLARRRDVGVTPETDDAPATDDAPDDEPPYTGGYDTN